MNERDWIQLALFVALLLALTPPLGRLMAKVFAGDRHFLRPVFGPVEKGIYKLAGIKSQQEMRWTSYLAALLAFNALGAVVLVALQITQAWLPLNPQQLPNVPFALAFNTAVSFVTNTNWQAYSGEATMSYFTQMAGLGVQNFVSAATGIAVAVALIHCILRRD